MTHPTQSPVRTILLALAAASFAPATRAAGAPADSEIIRGKWLASHCKYFGLPIAIKKPVVCFVTFKADRMTLHVNPYTVKGEPLNTTYDVTMTPTASVGSFRIGEIDLSFTNAKGRKIGPFRGRYLILSDKPGDQALLIHVSWVKQPRAQLLGYERDRDSLSLLLWRGRDLPGDVDTIYAKALPKAKTLAADRLAAYRRELAAGATRDRPNQPLDTPDRKRIQGEWKVVEYWREGKKDPREEGATWIFSGRSFTMRAPRRPRGDEPAEVTQTFTLDDAVSPKRLVTAFLGLGKFEKIYRLDGDSLTVCSGKQDGPRPLKFSTTEEGGGNTLVKLTRVARSAPAVAKGKAPHPVARAIEGGGWFVHSMVIFGEEFELKDDVYATAEFAGGKMLLSVRRKGREKPGQRIEFSYRMEHHQTSRGCQWGGFDTEFQGVTGRGTFRNVGLPGLGTFRYVPPAGKEGLEALALTIGNPGGKRDTAFTRDVAVRGIRLYLGRTQFLRDLDEIRRREDANVKKQLDEMENSLDKLRDTLKKVLEAAPKSPTARDR